MAVSKRMSANILMLRNLEIGSKVGQMDRRLKVAGGKEPATLKVLERNKKLLDEALRNKERAINLLHEELQKKFSHLPADETRAVAIETYKLVMNGTPFQKALGRYP